MGELENNAMKGALLGVATVAVQMVAGSWLNMIPGGAQIITIATVTAAFVAAKMVKVI